MKFVEKIWGEEKIIENNEKYCLKKLIFNPRWRNSWHYHKEKDETFYVIHGKFHLITKDLLTGEEHEGLLFPNNVVRILPETLHRLTGLNFHNEVIEVSTPFYTDPEDVIRLEMGHEVYGIEENELHKKGRYLS